MDLRHIEDVIKDCKGGIIEKKEMVISNLEELKDQDRDGIDSSNALQMFLNHILISSIPGIRNSGVLELKSEECLRDAIKLLYEKNVFGAPIVDYVMNSNDGNYDTNTKFSDRYIGFIDFARMVLWSLEEREKSNIKHEETKEISNSGILSMLEEIPHIGQTKVIELAKSFLWDPFFPVHLEDTLFHVLLLLSKHRLQVVPVMERSNSRVIGFVTQIAVVQLLLQSTGLDWFDRIADKSLSEFRFENNGSLVYVYGDQSISDALHSLWENRVNGIPVIDRETKKLIGSVRINDIHLLTNDKLFRDRKTLTVEQFIHSDTRRTETSLDPMIERDVGAFLSAAFLRLKSEFLPRMDFPVTNRKTDTLKQAMRVLVESKSNCSFLVDEFSHLTGVVTLRDIIIQFSPPSIDSRINGAGFFQSALEQSGCHVENAKIVRNN
ncbi:CBS domain [Macleaya cordata]|uniref:CBS domain n=1 Tax=Macleaya cordata TaxID=56857 RepID=A0A200R7T1_MACCD|nr:CBS domain [Macleaya cordata]